MEAAAPTKPVAETQGAVRRRAAESLKAFARVFRNPALRRLELAWTGSVLGQWSFFVALGVFAFQAGGAAGVGLAGLLRVLPPAVAGAVVGGLGDRFPRVRVMVLSDLSRTMLLGLAGALIAVSGPPVTVYVLAGLAGLAATAFRPAQAATVPSLTERPEELTAANLVSITIESVGMFAGPAIGGFLLIGTSPQVVFFFAAAASLWSATVLSRLPRQEPPARPAPGDGEGLLRELLGGVTTVAGDARLKVIVGIYSAQTLVWGAVTVLVVVIALRLLHEGQSAVGFLSAAIGIGGVLGTLATLPLVGARRLAPGFGLGILFWGLPLLVIAAWPSLAAAAVCLAIVGAANTLTDVAGFTMLQRAVPDHVLARVFGLLESLLVATAGLGAVLTPVLVRALGTRGALLVAGAVLPVVLALTWRRLLQIDQRTTVPVDRLSLLRSVPIFAPLAAPSLERLAGALVPLDVAPGDDVVRQGDPGDRFYIVADGELDVAVDHQPARTLAPGDSFGEIALLREVPRTATVSAGAEGARLFALDRDEFLTAVMANPDSARAAADVAAARLAAFRPSWLAL